MTLRNAAGVTVVCKEPDDPEYSDTGHFAAFYWCHVACEAYGFQWIGRGREKPRWFLDLDIGVKERRAVERHIPSQCLPYEDRRPHGLRVQANGEVPDCLGTLFKDGKCPD